MKNIFLLSFISLSICAFAQKKDSSYTLIDFYRDNWARDLNTGKYYEKHDMDSFIRVNKLFKPDPNLMKGLSMQEIKQIFGEPSNISQSTNKYNETTIEYLYYGSQRYAVRGQSSFGKLIVLFDGKTNKVKLFDKLGPLVREE